MQSKVSIIIPVYNAGRLVERCLQSLFSQTLDSIEYIIINDGSSDDSMFYVRKVISAFPHREPLVKLINHHHNKGLAATRSEGLRIASGVYVTHCDADDWVDTTFYEEIYRKAEANKADILAANFIIEEEKNTIKYTFPLWENWDAFYRHPQWEFLAIWAHLIRKDFLLNHHLDFYSDINYAEDYGLLFRCYFYSRRNATYIGNSFYHYSKLNQNSMTANKYKIDNLKHKAKCLAHLSHFVESHGYNPSENVILVEEKRAVKEGFYLSDTPDYNLWRNKFPEITSIVINDSKLGLTYRIAWALGQYLNPWFFKTYLNFRK